MARKRPLTPTDTVYTLEMMENGQHKENSGSTSSMKKVFARRSNRLMNIVSHVPNNEVEPEKIEVADSDGQDVRVEEQFTNELKEPQTEGLSPEPTFIQGNMEEKLDFLVQWVKEFNSMIKEQNCPTRQKPQELDYKSLYIDAQGKIDSLIEEKHELTKRLEFTLGKVEAYEQMKDAVGNIKETILFSNFAKVTEAVIGIASQAGTAAKCSCFPVVGSPAHPPPPPPPPPATATATAPVVGPRVHPAPVSHTHPPALATANNNDHSRAVDSTTAAANVNELIIPPVKNQRGRKKKIKVTTT